jgi:carboxymethylenebutenolidase
VPDLTLTAADGFRLSSFRADPAGPPRGRVVVLQEIFGVNRHIRSLCTRLAEAGYSALAPALFDRIRPGFQSGYSEPEVEEARKLIPLIDWKALMLDVDAAIAELAKDGPVAVMGFCMGGSVAFRAATQRDDLAAAICFYGGAIVKSADQAPRCPTQMHFGDHDASIPMSDIETIQTKRPDCEIHVYPAGHGFNCDERASHEPESARLAWQRSLDFLARSYAAGAR